VQFIFEDDAFQPKQTLGNVNKFISQHQVQGMIVFGSSTSLAVANLAEQAHIPLIALATSDKVQQGRQYIMRLMLSVETEVSLMAAEIKRQAFRDIAIVATTQDGMLALRDGLIQRGAAPVLLAEDVAPDERCFRPVIAKLMLKQPQAVYMALLSPQGGLFATQLREAGYRGRLLAGSSMENPSQLAFGGSSLEGTLFTSVDDRAAARLFAQYTKRHAKSPSLLAVY
jgi:branched-chain amino acid transport system substrate-binding protein